MNEVGEERALPSSLRFLGTMNSPEILKFPNSFTDLAKVYAPPNDCCYENWSRIDPVRRMACPE
jgi:hypothetical protein